MDNELGSETLETTLRSVGRPGHPVRVVLFIHGFRLDFARVCSSARRISTALGPDTLTIVFSWPSGGRLARYLYDESLASRSAHDFQLVLDQVLALVPADHVHVLAHSLGCRTAVTAILGRSEIDGRLANLILVKPDINRTFFLRQHTDLVLRSSQITVYASRRDRVLFWSGVLHGHARLGQETKCIDAIRIVDVSRVQTGAFGHSIFDHEGLIIGGISTVITHQCSDCQTTCGTLSQADQ